MKQHLISNYKLVPIIFLIFIVLNVIMHKDEQSGDLATSYVGCKVLLAGQPNHLYDFDPHDYSKVSGNVWPDIARKSFYKGYLHPYVQTPLWAYILAPLCNDMRFYYFKILFLILEYTSLAGTIWLTASMWARRFLEQPLWLALLLVVFSLTTPVTYMGALAQTHPLFLFLTVLAIFLADKNKPVSAGLALAIAATVKITPAIFMLYWIINKQWRSALSFLAWFIAIFILSIQLLGAELNIDHLFNLKRISDILLVSHNNQSLAAWLSNQNLKTPETKHFFIHTLPLSSKILMYSSLTAILGFLFFIKKFKPGRFEFIHPYSVSLLLLASIMFANIAWSHYYIVLVIPAMILLLGDRMRPKWWVMVMVGIMAALNLRPIAMDSITLEMSDWSLLRGQFWSGIICMELLLYSILAFKKDEATAYPALPNSSLATAA